MYRAPRGTQDILPAQQPYWQFVRETAATVCQRYGFQPIDVPIFEETSLFVRGTSSRRRCTRSRTRSTAST